VAEVPARAFVETHHYSHDWPSPRFRYGLWERDALVGVAVLTVPMQKAVLTNPFPTLEPYHESLELGRFVLLDQVPANAESWFLGHAFRRARLDGIRGIVSFADPVPRQNGEGTVIFTGHRGTIYRATNALWAGRSKARVLTVLPDGTVLNERRQQKLRTEEQGHEGVERELVWYGATPRRAGETGRAYLARALSEIGVTQLRHRGNYRYLFTLGSPREKRAIPIGLPTGPYPQQEAA
jgi:hypothetical protein